MQVLQGTVLTLKCFNNAPEKCIILTFQGYDRSLASHNAVFLCPTHLSMLESL